MLKDISQEKSLINVISFVKESARMTPKSSCEDIDTLNYKEKSGSLVIDRSYQRNFIQTLEGASSYIESIFLGLIIPEIQVFENYHTGEREIIDGQQRVLSLLKFYRGEYRLTNLKEYPQLNGLYYKDLPPELRGVIKNFQVNIRTFTNEDELYKYVIFERLNTGAKKLNAQEVRNCIFRGDMIDMVKELAREQDIIELFKGAKNNRFERDEQVLSVISLMYYFNTEEGRDIQCKDSMRHRINEFLEISSDFSEEELERIKKRFIELAEFISCCVDMDECLHVLNGDTSNSYVSTLKTIRESLFIALDAYDLSVCESKINELKEKFYGVFASREYKNTFFAGGTKSYKMILDRNSAMIRAVESSI